MIFSVVEENHFKAILFIEEISDYNPNVYYRDKDKIR